MKKILVGLLVGLALLSFQGPASAVDVGLELLLLVDRSGSVDSSEFTLQRNGYASAFSNAAIQNAIANTPGGVAVAYVEWDTNQYVRLDWRLLQTTTDVQNFSTAISGLGFVSGGSTAPGSAINFGTTSIANNSYTGIKKVIDISGDGQQNAGATTLTASQNAYTAGITINGLPIMDDEPNLDDWYLANIVNPGHGFMELATFANFSDAIVRKIGTETGAVPEPATLLLLGIGLIGLARYGRKN